MALSNGGKWALGLSVLYAGVLAALLASKRRLARNPRREDETSFRFLEKAYGKPKPFDWSKIKSRYNLIVMDRDNIDEEATRKEVEREVLFWAPLVFRNDPLKLQHLERAIREGRVDLDRDPKDILRGRYVYTKRYMELVGLDKDREYVVIDQDVPFFVRIDLSRSSSLNKARSRLRKQKMRLRDSELHQRYFGDAARVQGYILPKEVEEEFLKKIPEIPSRIRRKLWKQHVSGTPIPVPAFPGARSDVKFFIYAGVHPKFFVKILRGKDIVDFINSGIVSEYSYIIDNILYPASGRDRRLLPYLYEIEPSNTKALSWLIWLAKSNKFKQILSLTPEFSYGGESLVRVPLIRLINRVRPDSFVIGDAPRKVFHDEIRQREENFVKEWKDKHAPAGQLRSFEEIPTKLPRGVTLLRTQKALSEEGNRMNHCVGRYADAVRGGANIFHVETGHGAPTTLHLGPAPELQVIAHLGKYNREPDIWARAKVNLLLRRLGKPRHYLKNARARAARRRRGR